jgi:hypothetical protein
MSSPFINEQSPVLTQQGPALNIQVGAIPNDDAEAQFDPPANPLDIWTDYVIENKYEEDPHVYMLPITSPEGFSGKKAAFCKLASDTVLWVCDWTAARWNTAPEAPNPTPADSNWVLLNKATETRNVEVGPDGQTALYRISGTYVYGYKSPPTNLYELVAFGRPPYLLDSYTRSYPDYLLEGSLMDFPAKSSPGLAPGGPIIIK